ncbi:DUF6177 family protein [Streptomyces erythrochromogenes]|uniref:DUF6177 family protein n=1 Tax=Streptomyces erythrochromogenes TaxID=285574 RepID=UPI00343E96BA
MADDRAPRSTWTVAVGTPDRPAVATLRVIRTPEGAEEDATLTVGYGPGEEIPLEALPGLAEELVTRYGLKTMLCQLREARRDLSTPPHYEHPPLPYAFVLGPAEVQEAGRDTASRAPLKAAPVQLGPKARPGFYYALGDAETPRAGPPWRGCCATCAAHRPPDRRRRPRSGAGTHPAAIRSERFPWICIAGTSAGPS